MSEFLREAWAYALALVFYGLSLALILFGVVMAWMAVKDVAGGSSAGEGVVANLVVAVVGLLMVGAGVLIGRVSPRIIRALSGTDAPPPPPTA